MAAESKIGYVDPQENPNTVSESIPAEDVNKIIETDKKSKTISADDPIKYESAESTTQFNFSNLLKKVKYDLKKKYGDMSEDKFIAVMYKTLKTFKLNEQSFDYIFSRNNLGGVRWYVKCPKCSRPSLKLFLPTKFPNREQRYLCKYCHHLKNASLLMGATKRYKKVHRPLKKLETIKQQLLKKNITPERAKPLLDKYELIERELSKSPEYRLWKFQKEHAD